MKHKKRNILFSAVCSGLVLVLFFKMGLFDSVELKTLDFRFRLFNQPEKASKDIVLVAIDENSLRGFKKNNNIVWKWPRDFYAILVAYLNKGGAKTIVFDMLFSDYDIDRLSSDAAESDGYFAGAMKDAGNVILAMHLRQQEDFLSGDNPLVWKNNISYPAEIKNLDIPVYSDAIFPIPIYQNSAYGLGVANYYQDPDGISRRFPIFFSYQNNLYPHLGLSAFLKSKNISDLSMDDQQRIVMGDLSVPVNEKGQFLINWYGKGGPDGCFTYYSIGPLISSAAAEMNGEEPMVPSSEFKDKVVIIGSNAPALSDFHNTPFTVYEPYPGMEIYATVISNLLQRDFLKQAGNFVSILTVLFFVFVISCAFLYIRKIKFIIVLSVVCALGWLIVAFGLFKWAALWVDIVAPEVTIFFVFALSAIISYQTEGKARRRLRSVFGKYLSPVVISEIIEKNDQVELGGKELTATIFFSDIKDFTTISEKISPTELVALLNDYFSAATDVILNYQGLIDKYIGDAIMAVFGAPVFKKNHAELACAAALIVQEKIKKLWQGKNKHKPELLTRIGINTGNIVVGNIGSSLRLDYTAIGDSVNLASRLEGVNKVYATNIIISESTYLDVKDQFLTRSLDRLRVKGKNEPVLIYELMSKKEDAKDSLVALSGQFQEGIACYNQKDFEKAKRLLLEIIKDFPDDGPSNLYLKRCQQFMENPPAEDWDGVFLMETK